MTPRDPLGRDLFERVDEDGVHREAAPGQLVCDFCLEPDPPWGFHCGEVEIVGNPLMNASDDDWLACRECRDLIEADAPATEIARRAVEGQRLRDVLSPYMARPWKQAVALMARNIDVFLRSRTGDAFPVDPKTGRPITEGER